MVNEILSPVNREKVQSIMDGLTKDEKKVLLNLLKGDENLPIKQEYETPSDSYGSVFAEIIIDHCKFDL